MLPKWPEITWLYSSKNNSPFVLGINPWVYDFAAFNLWSRPMGLIAVMSYLYKAKANVAVLDCMYKMWRDVNWPKPEKYGTGHYPKTIVPKPYIFMNIPRNYARYGLELSLVKEALKKLTPIPDLVLITSVMTYWYPGVICIVNMVRELWPKTPVVVGGIYTTLCYEHARNHLDTIILKGAFEDEKNLKYISSIAGISSISTDDFDLSLQGDFYPHTQFGVLMLTRGCPFKCDYCASRSLYPSFWVRSFEKAFKEFEYLYKKGIRNFAFYDDALLVEPQKALIPFLELVLKKNMKVNFHVPNGLHVRFLNKEICHLLKRAGFVTIRLGLETVNFNKRNDFKLTKEEWEEGIKNLLSAGFSEEHLGAYILFGLPDQQESEIFEAIKFVKEYGIKPYLAYYSPIPCTKMFDRAKRVSQYDLNEPLTHNRSIWPCIKKGFSWEERAKWRRLLYYRKKSW